MLRLLTFLNQQFDDPRRQGGWSPMPPNWVPVAVLSCLIAAGAVFALIDWWLWLLS